MYCLAYSTYRYFRGFLAAVRLPFVKQIKVLWALLNHRGCVLCQCVFSVCVLCVLGVAVVGSIIVCS